MLNDSTILFLNKYIINIKTQMSPGTITVSLTLSLLHGYNRGAEPKLLLLIPILPI